MQNPEIVIIGAAIIDVLAYPVNVKVFETGSYSTEDIHMTTGADALNEATILAKKGRRVQLESKRLNFRHGYKNPRPHFCNRSTLIIHI